jgi:acyl-ACP thioesterase
MDNKQDRLTYEKKILIRSEQVDMTRRLRMSELFRIMEEASIAHTEELGCTRDRTLDRGLLWIITRQQAEIEELPAYDEEITVRSWQGDMMHVFFPRFYEIERAGRVIVRGQALWMLIDEESRQMVMPEDYDIFIPGRPGSDDMMLAPVVIPSELREGESGNDVNSGAGAGTVIRQNLVTRFSQVDINGHMNNTRYFDIIDDALYTLHPADSNDESNSGTGTVKTIPRLVRANYLSELRAGDCFTLTGYAERSSDSATAEGAGTGTALYFEGADGDKVKFRIAYEF